MNNRQALDALTKAELIELIDIYSKNWLALDGVWFQSVERKHGMDEAMFHDGEAWRSFTVIEAKRLKEFLKLPEHAGLEGLAKALELRFYGNLNAYELIFEDKNSFSATWNAGCRRRESAKTCPFIPANPSASLSIPGLQR